MKNNINFLSHFAKLFLECKMIRINL